ncbi:MAG TPA: 50S ribosomal protein L4 [Herpetosiphon sp.]|jgi:large subunit ribosomal protein L4|uniref:Large ribosomal subunit protein uL4 n=1 Tax=Herpetosiphon aurantiacus (strain ATCC 23779 / DSM 785 / 114-95) TaxID=316274 RepID=A9B413_HERA2|nr:50S ribosomal protein L4 [Herpetosiphon sp.]ABX07546.1 ribosomal protein L4/L1e [Herpetosiphon aurantiacus DSM 785]MCA0353129.1 50S ribosomal protein L4 [Chloroflexota bacterium]HBW49680.1 50S ribosomal protein L4 [Herpetosiphon sp.]
MEAKLYNQAGQAIGTLELQDYIFGIEPNIPVMHQAVIRQLANARLGTHSTKTRGEVRGSTRKLYRQKGTGRARQGAIRAPHHSGGGVVHGPKPRKYTKAMPRKMRRLAVRSALSAKYAENQIIFLDDLSLNAPKTKDFLALLKNLPLVGDKTLVALGEKSDNITLSASNLPNVKTLLAAYLNVRDLLTYDTLILPKSALSVVETILGKK